MFCFAGRLVVVHFTVNAHVAVICRGNSYVDYLLCDPFLLDKIQILYVT